MRRDIVRATVLVLSITSCVGPPAATPKPPPTAPRTELPSVVTAFGGDFDPADRDGDGIGDAYDLCPSLLEDQRGPHPMDGCPDARDPAKLAVRWGPTPRQAVSVTHDQIKITEQISFALSSATIDASSQPLLQSIAQVLKDAPEIEIVEIAGHADDTGFDAANKRLTAQRSAAVMNDIAGKGVNRARLRASGYSAYCLIDTGKEEASRARNRRVEFRILRRDGKDLEPRWGGCDEAARRGMKPPPLPPLKPRASAKAEEAAKECSDANPKECKARCDVGEAEACVALATALGAGRPRDAKSPRSDPHGAFAALSQACGLDHLEACALVAESLRSGAGVTKDAKKALDLDAKSCAKGGGAACVALGLAYHQGVGVARDDAKSLEAYRQACDVGDGEGCEALGKTYWFGTGVKEDHPRALELFVAACEIGGSGCKTLRDRVKDDPASLRSRERTLVALHVACEQDGDSDACGAIRIVEEKPGEYSPAPLCAAGDYAACRAACAAAKAGDACVGFGLALLYGTGARRKPAEATQIFDDACHDGSARGCAMSAVLHEAKGAKPRELRVAVDQYETACTGGEPSGCVNRARLQLEGLGTYRDEAAAAKTLDAACAQGIGIACAHLAAMTAKGLGVAQSPARAKTLSARACAVGFRPSCAPAPQTATH